MSDRFPFDNQDHEPTQQDVLDRTEPDVELLVAYLDGEMDSQGVRRMEDRLSVEPDLREKMASLEQTWNMLGELETVPVDKELVRSTMEVVALTIEKELGDDEKKVDQRKLHDRMVLIAILVMFGVIGYQLAAMWGLHIKNQLLEDIPLIRQISLYKEIGSFDFLKALSEKGVFDPPANKNEEETLQQIFSEEPSPSSDIPAFANPTGSVTGALLSGKEEQP